MSDWEKTCEFAAKLHAVSHDQLTRVQRGEELTEQDHIDMKDLAKEQSELFGCSNVYGE